MVREISATFLSQAAWLGHTAKRDALLRVAFFLIPDAGETFTVAAAHAAVTNREVSDGVRMSARAASDAPLPEDLDLAIETLRHLASGLPPELAEVLIAGVELLTMERAACRAP